jgi:hypothetical protein
MLSLPTPWIAADDAVVAVPAMLLVSVSRSVSACDDLDEAAGRALHDRVVIDA